MGEPKYIIVDTNKDKFGRRNRDVFDVNWNHQELEIKYPRALVTPQRPDELDKMLVLTRKISRGFKCIRVDWFVTKDQLLFNQVKFSPGNGVEKFFGDNYEKILGDLIAI